MEKESVLTVSNPLELMSETTLGGYFKYYHLKLKCQAKFKEISICSEFRSGFRLLNGLTVF
jgi:hypothetical protein